MAATIDSLRLADIPFPCCANCEQFDIVRRHGASGYVQECWRDTRRPGEKNRIEPFYVCDMHSPAASEELCTGDPT